MATPTCKPWGLVLECPKCLSYGFLCFRLVGLGEQGGTGVGWVWGLFVFFGCEVCFFCSFVLGFGWFFWCVFYFLGILMLLGTLFVHLIILCFYGRGGAELCRTQGTAERENCTTVFGVCVVLCAAGREPCPLQRDGFVSCPCVVTSIKSSAFNAKGSENFLKLTSCPMQVFFLQPA